MFSVFENGGNTPIVRIDRERQQHARIAAESHKISRLLPAEVSRLADRYRDSCSSFHARTGPTRFSRCFCSLVDRGACLRTKNESIIVSRFVLAVTKLRVNSSK